jgi:hypothetical protein
MSKTSESRAVSNTVVETTVKMVTTVTPVVSAVKTILDFEDCGTTGLVPTSYFQGSVVAPTAKITNQYIDKGVVLSNAALVALGLGHAASGVDAIAGISADGKIDYDAPVTISFVKEVDTMVTTTTTARSITSSAVKGNGKSIEKNNDDSDSHKNEHGKDPVNDHDSNETVTVNVIKSTVVTPTYVDGTVNYFSYSPDFDGASGNTITVSAYDLVGKLVGSVSVREVGNIVTPIVLTGIGEFHSVTIDSTLVNKSWGGIAMDMVTYGEVHSPVVASSHTDTSFAAVTLVGVSTATDSTHSGGHDH